jgi:hypothetical protein
VRRRDERGKGGRRKAGRRGGGGGGGGGGKERYIDAQERVDGEEMSGEEATENADCGLKDRDAGVEVEGRDLLRDQTHRSLELRVVPEDDECVKSVNESH